MVALDYGTLTLLFAFWVAMKIWQKLGGWPEAYYRIRGIKYFQQYIIESDTTISRYILKSKLIQSHSIAKFTNPTRSGDWIIPGGKDTEKAKFANPNNRPAYLYEYNDSRPIPVLDRSAKKMDPMLVHSGFKNKILEELNNLTHPPSRRLLTLEVMIALFILMLSFASAYYAYNAACAAHSQVCIATGPSRP